MSKPWKWQVEMGMMKMVHISISLLGFLCILKGSMSINQMSDKCTEASVLINNITATTPLDEDGCVMQFQTKRGTCCLIGVKLNQREHFKGRYFMDKKCFKLKCLYNGKKKWEKCKCQVNKVKLPKKKKNRKSKSKSKSKKRTTTKPPSPTTPKPPSSNTPSKSSPSSASTETPSKPAEPPALQSDQNSLAGRLLPPALRPAGPPIMASPPGSQQPPSKPVTTTPRPRLTSKPSLGKPCVIPGTGQMVSPGNEIPELNYRRGQRCLSAYCSKEGEIVFDENDCMDVLDMTTRPVIGTTQPFRFMTLWPEDDTKE